MKTIFSKTKYLIPIIQFITTCFTDKFSFGNYRFEHLGFYIFIKAILLVLMFIFWNFVFKIILEIKNKNTKTINFVKIFFIILLINSILLILIFPGNWLADEIDIIIYCRSLSIFYWQGWFSSIFFILAYSTCPFPATIVFIQFGIISFIISYIISNLYEIYQNKIIYLSLIILCMPIFLLHNQFTQRCSILAYIELFLLSFLYIKYKKNEKINIKELAIFTFLSIILSAARSETLIFFVIFIALLLIFFKNQITQKKVLIYFLTCIIFIPILNYMQTVGLKNESGGGIKFYTFVSIAPTVCELTDMERPLILNDDRKYIEDIIINIRKNNEYVWKLRENFNPEITDEFVHLFFKYIKINWKSFYKNRFTSYLSNQVFLPPYLREQFNIENGFNNNFHFEKIHNKIISFYDNRNKFICVFNYGSIYLCILAFAILVGVLRRNMFLIIVSLCLITHFLIMITLVPDITYIMYFFFTFIGGAIYGPVAIVELLPKRDKKIKLFQKRI